MKNLMFATILLGLFGLAITGCETPITNSPEDLDIELRSAVPVPFHGEYIAKLLVLRAPNNY